MSRLVDSYAIDPQAPSNQVVGVIVLTVADLERPGPVRIGVVEGVQVASRTRIHPE